MKIQQEQLQKLAEALISTYRAKELIVSGSADGQIKKKVAEVIAKNFADEEAIEAEARQMLASHGQAARDLDSYKMFLLAKQKLAAKKGFIL
jgi:hypothetical protein